MIPAMVISFGAATPLDLVLALVPVAFVIIGVGLLAVADVLVDRHARRSLPPTRAAATKPDELSLDCAA